MDMNSLVDVRDVLPAVRVPTLVLHRSGDALFDVAEGKYIADRWPARGSRCWTARTTSSSANPDQILDAVEPFVTESQAPAPPRLALAALVAVTGAGSDAVLAGLTAAGGRVREDPAGRPVLLFDGPAAAVRAAMAQRRDDVGVGIAVAEVEREATVVRGPGVREATDIADLAPTGEVWLSATVGVLLAGSTIEVEPVGNDQRVLRPALIGRSSRWPRSGGGDVHRHLGAVGDDVEHGRPLARLLDQRGELRGLRVPVDVEDDPDALVAVADLGVEAEDATQVDVALDGRR